MSKYRPLQTYLENRQHLGDMTLTFSQIEEILGDRLPRSAHVYQEWWSNEIEGSHVQAKAWLNAGWSVDDVNQARERVRFVRA